jgi:hypothetical protein
MNRKQKRAIEAHRKKEGSMSKKLQLDLKQVLLNLQGEPIKTPLGAPATLKFILAEACLQGIEGEKLSGAAKYHLGGLAALVQSAEVVEITTDELAILRRRVGEVFEPLAVKQTWDMLDKAELTASPKLEAVPEEAK